MKHEKPKSKLLTVKEVANYLVVTERTVYRLIKDPRFPAYKVGGQWRFKIELIDDWMRGDRANVRSGVLSGEGERSMDAGALAAH